MLGDVVQVGKDDLDAVRDVFERSPGRVAAVFAEPVIGAGGVWPPAPGYLEGLRALCDEHGAHLVLDEVICGFGRLGTWFGAPALRGAARPRHLRQGRHAGYVPLGGVLGGAGGARRCSRPTRPSAAPRPHLQRPPAPRCAAGLDLLDITERRARAGAEARRAA